jgi:hypothetical protein
MVTDAQVRRYQEKRMTGHSMAASAAAAGMSERTGRRWNGRGLPSASKEPRTYRTRPDPFADVWSTEIEPHLVADADGRLQALTLFEWLCERQPNRFRPGQVRTLQRRMREWRARHGPAPAVFLSRRRSRDAKRRWISPMGRAWASPSRANRSRICGSNGS